MRRLFRSALPRFLLIGAALSAFASWREPSPPARETIVVSAARLEDLRSEWERTHGEAAGPEDEAWLVEREIEDEVIFREALRYGLDRDNTFVRYRLVTLMRFLGDDEETSDDVLVRDARKLGLHRTDLVIRRHLVETVRLIGAKALRREPVGETELRVALEENRERFRRPARIALTHVFFGTDGRGDNALADAERSLVRLRAGEAADGDPFIHGARIALLSEAELAARFGDAFAREVFAMPVGEWSGPLRSGYGFHVVRVDERRQSRVPGVEDVRGRLVRQVEAKRADERLRGRIAEWRSRYDVVVGGAA